jgi:hypothetical protein
MLLSLIPYWAANSTTRWPALTFPRISALISFDTRFAIGRPLFQHYLRLLSYFMGYRSSRSDGDIDLLILDLDASAWTRLITGGLANRVIQLPEMQVK